MNIKFNCKILIILLLAFSHHLWAIKLPDGTEADISTFERYENKKFKSVVFLETTEFEKPFGTFSATAATFYKSGALESLTCQKGTVKTPLGELSVSVWEHEYEGCNGRSYSFECDNVVLFHEKGGIKEIHVNKFFIDEDYDDGVLAGLPCGGNTLIRFYPDGKIESIETYLGEGLMDAHVLNTKYGSLVIFGNDGDNYYNSGRMYTINLYNSGKLKTTTLGTGRVLGLSNHSSDYREWLSIHKPVVLNISDVGKLEIDGTLELWENGNVKRVHFPKKRTFEVGDEIFSCESLEFYEDGKSIHIVDDGVLKFTKDGKIEKEIKQVNKKK